MRRAQGIQPKVTRICVCLLCSGQPRGSILWKQACPTHRPLLFKPSSVNHAEPKAKSNPETEKTHAAQIWEVKTSRQVKSLLQIANSTPSSGLLITAHSCLHAVPQTLPCRIRDQMDLTKQCMEGNLKISWKRTCITHDNI